ncbi:hypothetical protein D3C78_1540930 [compost metagenome]
MLDRPGDTHSHIDPCGHPGAGGPDLSIARHEAVIHRHPRRALGGAEGHGGAVEQLPVLDPVAAGHNELGFGHGNRGRVDSHRAEVFDTWQAARHACG